MTKNPIHPKKLLLSKWTAVMPENKEKHFMVIKVIEPEVEGGPVAVSYTQLTLPTKA